MVAVQQDVPGKTVETLPPRSAKAMCRAVNLHGRRIFSMRLKTLLLASFGAPKAERQFHPTVLGWR